MLPAALRRRTRREAAPEAPQRITKMSLGRASAVPVVLLKLRLGANSRVLLYAAGQARVLVKLS